ncbi:hypothetical protein ACOSQ2_018711 [Xanthoceras sorbifolium]
MNSHLCNFMSHPIVKLRNKRNKTWPENLLSKGKKIMLVARWRPSRMALALAILAETEPAKIRESAAKIAPLSSLISISAPYLP